MKRFLLLGFLGAFACGGGVPNHPTCTQDSECPSGDACHLPPGGASGVCAVTCLSDSSCPSSEPFCLAESTAGTSPFSFCACATVGPDAGISQGCGANAGYGCSPEMQVCLSR